MGNQSRVLAITVFALGLAVAGCNDTPPTGPTPVSTGSSVPTPSGSAAELRVICPATIATDDVAFCRSEGTVNGQTSSATEFSQWSSSNPLVVENIAHRITGVNPGTSDITAVSAGLTATAPVTVVAGANGNFQLQFNPAFNNCGMPIRTTLTGEMAIDFASGALSIGGGVQNYALSFAMTSGRVTIAGRHSSNGFEYTLNLAQEEARVRRYVGREDIRCPDGRTAQYLAIMQVS